MWEQDSELAFPDSSCRNAVRGVVPQPSCVTPHSLPLGPQDDFFSLSSSYIQHIFDKNYN